MFNLFTCAKMANGSLSPNALGNGIPMESKFLPLMAVSVFVVGLFVMCLRVYKLYNLLPRAANFSLYGLIPFPNDLCVNTWSKRLSDIGYEDPRKLLRGCKFSSVVPYTDPLSVLKTSSGFLLSPLTLLPECK